MKAVLTCDDVFDVLTREPFPSGGVDDEVVESHLAVCHECRQLAEAFRPAVGLFHEALSAGVDDELPMYRGRLKPVIEALPPVPLFAPRTDCCSQSEKRQPSILRSLAMAASLIVVASAVFAAWAGIQRSSRFAPVASNLRIETNRDYTLLATLEIPRSCRSLLEHSDRPLTAEFVCCTKCHHATSRMASTKLAISKTSAACAACHDRVPGAALSMVTPRNQLCESLLAYSSMQNL